MSNKAPTGPWASVGLSEVVSSQGPVSLPSAGPCLTPWATTDTSRASVPKLRALSPGPPVFLFSESQRPLAPRPCAAARSGAASTSPPCCTRRKELVLVGPLTHPLSHVAAGRQATSALHLIPTISLVQGVFFSGVLKLNKIYRP